MGGRIRCWTSHFKFARVVNKRCRITRHERAAGARNAKAALEPGVRDVDEAAVSLAAHHSRQIRIPPVLALGGHEVDRVLVRVAEEGFVRELFSAGQYCAAGGFPKERPVLVSQ
eukprot:3939071-Rhodomonas_salina.2